MFNPGQRYVRRDIHKLFGGQEQGGISTPAKHKVIFLFSGERGPEHGYVDGWQKNGMFYYTGEGQRGDMQFVRGNAAIRDHLSTGRQIHLFRQLRNGLVEYICELIYRGFHYQQGKDTDNLMRQIIIFELERKG